MAKGVVKDLLVITIAFSLEYVEIGKFNQLMGPSKTRLVLYKTIHG